MLKHTLRSSYFQVLSVKEVSVHPLFSDEWSRPPTKYYSGHWDDFSISKSQNPIFPTRLDTVLSTLNFASVNAHMFVLFQDADDKRLHWIEQTTNYDRTLTSSARDESSTKPVWRWRVWSNSRTAIKMTIRDRDLRLSRLQVHGRVLRGRIEGFRKAVPGDSPADSHEAPTTANGQPSTSRYKFNSACFLSSSAWTQSYCTLTITLTFNRETRNAWNVF